jgi:hypothetical protein
MADSIAERAMRWTSQGETGASSLTMFAVMTGNKPRYGYSYPLDGSDLGRCLKLLALIPEWRARLDEMRSAGPVWSALVDHWDELATLHAEDSPKLYQRMKAIIWPAEDKAGDVIRLGNVSIRRGR